MSSSEDKVSSDNEERNEPNNVPVMDDALELETRDKHENSNKGKETEKKKRKREDNRLHPIIIILFLILNLLKHTLGIFLPTV